RPMPTAIFPSATPMPAPTATPMAMPIARLLPALRSLGVLSSAIRPSLRAFPRISGHRTGGGANKYADNGVAGHCAEGGTQDSAADEPYHEFACHAALLISRANPVAASWFR